MGVAFQARSTGPGEQEMRGINAAGNIAICQGRGSLRPERKRRLSPDKMLHKQSQAGPQTGEHLHTLTSAVNSVPDAPKRQWLSVGQIHVPSRGSF